MKYLKRTWKNKLVALLLLFASWVPIWLDRDATIFLLMLPINAYLFFTSRDCFSEEERHD